MFLGKVLVSLALLVPQTAGTATEELTEAKKADLERFIQLTTAPTLIRLISGIVEKDVTESLQNAIPNLPDAGRKAALDETDTAIQEFASQFLQDLYPTYNRLFTDAELREILAFYDGPLGKKMLAAAPVLELEARAVAEKSVKPLYPRITQRVIARLQKEGFMKR